MAHSASYTIVTGGCFPRSKGEEAGVKQQRHEGDHSSPSRTKVKNGGAIVPLPIYLHGMVLNY
jgi:hypothetical protein